MENRDNANNKFSSDNEAHVRDDEVDSEADVQEDEIGAEDDLLGEEHEIDVVNEDVWLGEEIMEKPCIGMEFSSDESAHKFYSNFGGKKGFNVRINRKSRNNKRLITRVVYVCSKEGYRKEAKKEKSFSKPITRIGCNAHMTCRLQQSTGKFRVVSFNETHNHELVKTPMKHMLKGNRCMSKAQKEHADNANLSGISVKATMELMSREVGGRENLGFMDVDYRNYIHRKRAVKMQKGDAGAICQYLQKRKEDNSSFFFSFQLDEDDMITNIFWADEQSISDYALFGDVLCFDTTYKTNEYGRPFAPFVGVNHHKQSVIFGAALLYDETIESFKWLFETFLEAMKASPPKTILTDQSAAMANAISQVCPSPTTRHRLCVWHIYQNAAKKLSHVFHGSEQFAHDLANCIYDYEDEVEWLSSWNNMLQKHSLEQNTWLKELFHLREKWALVYGRHTFTADMMSTQRSESLNSVLKKYLKPSHNLSDFFDHWERVLKDRRYEELVANFKMLETSPVLYADLEMLQHAKEVYTPEVFKLFQQEYRRINDYVATKFNKSGMQYEYKVSYRGVSGEHLVKYDGSMQTVNCSCMKFSFVGILCRHSLKILDKKNVRRIPSCYILNRWSKEAKARTITSYLATNTSGDDPKESTGRRYSHLCRNFREIASYAAEHELLTTHAHELSVELLKSLEAMKKDIFKPAEDGIAKGVLVQDKTEANNSEIIKARGVKRKNHVGRPPGTNKSKCLPGYKNTGTSKVPAKRPLSFQDSVPNNDNLNVQHVMIHEVPVAPISTQVQYMHFVEALSIVDEIIDALISGIVYRY